MDDRKDDDVDTTTTQPVGLLEIGGRTHMRVQLQFDKHGEHATAVSQWLDGHYRHVACGCKAQPGLCVTLTVADADPAGFDTWQARLVAALSPVDVALEVLAECFDELGLGAARLLSLHATD